jgi:hypothetical protein
MNHRAEVARIMARQHALVTRAQARACGMTDRAIDRMVASGAWTNLGHAVYHLAGAPFTWHTRVMAACLGGSAVASHRTGAVLLGLDAFSPGPPEVIVPHGKHFRPEGVRVHEVRDFDLRDERRLHGIPTCSPDTVLFQLAGLVGWEATGAAMDSAIRQGLTDWPALYRALTLHARRGRKGTVLFRTMLDTRWGTRIPDSRWNRQVADLLIDAGVEAPVLEHEIYGPDGELVGRVDLAWPRQMVIVELQSMKYHLNERAFHADPLRRNQLQRLGWLVLEYTWRYYVDHPARLCEEVRDHLAARPSRTVADLRR